MTAAEVGRFAPAGPGPAGGPADIPAKFALPVAHHVVDRPRLHALLTARSTCPVTLVAATAGWGKTMLAASWVAAGAGGRAAAWVSLAKGDDDPRAFWRTVATALLPATGPRPRSALRAVAAHAGDVDELPGRLAAALRSSDRAVVLVLDNLHEVTSAEVHAGLLRLVERPLPTLSLLATTRRAPPWPLPHLRTVGLLAEVGAEHLAFRLDETAALFAQLNVVLDDSQLERLLERTEGWPAGLRLAALHLRGRADVEAGVQGFSGDTHGLAAYLDTEVLEQQPPELLDFLRKISTVELVCADLADAITERDDSAQVLAELAESHLFVQAVGRPGRWYRLHRLITDILRARPARPREQRDLHGRAAVWFAEHGMPLDAISSAVAAELWPLAADLVGAHAVGLALNGQARELERVLAAAPRMTPELAGGLAGARVVQGNGTDVAHLLATARAGAGDLRGRRAARARVLLDLVGGGLARLQGDWDAAAAIHRRVPVDPAALAGLGMADVELVAVTVNNSLGTAAFWAGDHAAADRHLRAAIEQGLPALALPQLNAAAYRALLCCERGELAEARRSALEVVSTASESGLERTAQVVAAYLTMARVVLDRGDGGEADEWLGRVADVESVAPEPHVRLAAALLLAARRETAGDRDLALLGLRTTTAQLGSWDPPHDLREQLLLTRARLLMRSGDDATARRLLHELAPPMTAGAVLASARLSLLLGDGSAAVAARTRVEAASHPRARADTAVLHALLAEAADDQEEAQRHLEDALVAAAPDGLRWTFLADAAHLRPLLERRLERGTLEPAFALDLLARMSGRPAADGEPQRPFIDPLTERERTILRYLAGTLSNSEVAAELYVSVNTVKTHQRAVYRKLGVANRGEAVHRARALHLL